MTALAIILAACLVASVWVNVAYSQMVSDLVKQRNEAALAETEAYLAVQDALDEAEAAREALADERAAHTLTAAELIQQERAYLGPVASDPGGAA